MAFTIHNKNGFKYLDEGEGEVMLLLHGLFGALSNWDDVVNKFSKNYRVMIPLLPVYERSSRKEGVIGLTHFLERFIDEMNLHNMTIMGNSLGGHIALIYTINNQEKVDRLVLTGSSGLFENSMGGSFPKRGSYAYIKERVEYTFYDPSTVTKEYIDEVFETTTSIPKCMAIVGIAKSAQRHNLANDLHKITVPTLLVWGLNDTITPPLVAHDFNRLIPNSKLRFIDKCCHAPMMEQPEKFNAILEEFLEEKTLV
ncbi:pimeloyl-ACP methyl ester carboxylesterase [Catalinimonas alkaloidigena]|uniref:alpha/beta fold hydrolase n=1 Tax=Catalinimonas alkaloidigena TaxID=1075417 RepID=UPI002404FE7C|nr:alpha/beta hydrolase [Catalinimonas alkaloidigena]MDF9800935.1 pimeloyl-ACP methyl ester carboxylesterase [Catalinimonas alkaloidigena]